LTKKDHQTAEMIHQSGDPPHIQETASQRKTSW